MTSHRVRTRAWRRLREAVGTLRVGAGWRILMELHRAARRGMSRCWRERITGWARAYWSADRGVPTSIWRADAGHRAYARRAGIRAQRGRRWSGGTVRGLHRLLGMVRGGRRRVGLAAAGGLRVRWRLAIAVVGRLPNGRRVRWMAVVAERVRRRNLDRGRRMARVLGRGPRRLRGRHSRGRPSIRIQHSPEVHRVGRCGLSWPGLSRPGVWLLSDVAWSSRAGRSRCVVGRL